MNILCDCHHSDLWWSHHLILEKELGHKLFRPRGMEWFKEGYYFPQNEDIARQFLVDSLWEFSYALRVFPNIVPRIGKNDGLYVGGDTIHGCPYYPYFNTLTLEEFKQSPIDVLMATVSNHQSTFLELRDKYMPKAKLIREEGNVSGQYNLHPLYRNLMTSDIQTFDSSQMKNKVLYHQRFDTENIFYPEIVRNTNTISSFHPGFRKTPEMVSFADAHLGQMENFKFEDYGFDGKNGWLQTKGEFASAMRKCSFVWHVKPVGDGFGHVIHNAFSVGRPVITVGDHYENRIASKLMVDEQTCIFLDKEDISGNIQKINRNVSRLDEMSMQASTAFKNIVDYDEEKLRIKKMLEELE